MTVETSQKRMLANLAGIFFLSGAAALIYQVSWQRLLFSGIGVDLTSTTVIISVFMLGLGIGAWFGRRIADYFPRHMLQIFCLFELTTIGIFGACSYFLILWAEGFLAQADMLTVAAVNFLLLLLPTFMMGSTLPLLTCFFNQYIENIGEAIGTLYFYNTAGAALGSFACGFILYDFLTLSQATRPAAGFNFLISGSVFPVYGRKKLSTV